MVELDLMFDGVSRDDRTPVEIPTIRGAVQNIGNKNTEVYCTLSGKESPQKRTCIFSSPDTFLQTPRNGHAAGDDSMQPES